MPPKNAVCDFHEICKSNCNTSGNSHGHTRCIHTRPVIAYRWHSFIFLPVQNRLELVYFSKPDGVICTLVLCSCFWHWHSVWEVCSQPLRKRDPPRRFPLPTRSQNSRPRSPRRSQVRTTHGCSSARHSFS